jgi:proline dehydrogenase
MVSTSSVTDVLRRGLLTCWAPIRRRSSSAYRAGPRLDDALAVCRRLAAHGLGSTIGYTAGRGEPARSAADAYLEGFHRLAAEELDCYVSMKPSALGFDARLVGELEAAAVQSGRRLHLDALAPDVADETWRLLDGAANTGSLGMTLPGRWRRSAGDATRAVNLGVAVRVVKGQWPDNVDGGLDPAKGFLDVVDRLHDHAGGVALATHDVPLLAESLRRLAAAGGPREVELFYGLPFRDAALVARRAGVPVRVYVPYGHGGAPYGGADLVSRPRVAWWLAQDLLLGERKTWRGIRRAYPST